MKRMSDLRVCIIHDWLVTYTGAEKVLEQLITIFPQADLCAVVDTLPERDRGFLRGKKVTTSFIQKLPFARKRYRSFLPLMPLAIEGFNLSGYDLIISSSFAVAKGVLTGPDQIHICYCHSPIRYAWDLTHQYLQQAGLAKGMGRSLARLMLHYIRMWDTRTSNGVDLFVANSLYIGRRIKKSYGRSASVIYPPVDTHSFVPGTGARDDYYLVVSRFVPYKRIPLIIEAFAKLPHLKLRVIGDGPGFEESKKSATPNVELMGYQSKQVVVESLQKAKAFVFAAEEDFGIAVVEAQACGTPVICFGKGGTTETVIQDRTGITFDEQTPESIVAAIRRFEALPGNFSHVAIRENAERFSAETFRRDFYETVLVTLESSRTIVREHPIAVAAAV